MFWMWRRTVTTKFTLFDALRRFRSWKCCFRFRVNHRNIIIVGMCGKGDSSPSEVCTIFSIIFSFYMQVSRKLLLDCWSIDPSGKHVMGSIRLLSHWNSGFGFEVMWAIYFIPWFWEARSELRDWSRLQCKFCLLLQRVISLIVLNTLDWSIAIHVIFLWNRFRSCLTPARLFW